MEIIKYIIDNMTELSIKIIAIASSAFVAVMADPYPFWVGVFSSYFVFVAIREPLIFLKNKFASSKG